MQQAATKLFDAVQQDIPDTQVVSPFTPQTARQVSSDGTIAYAEVNLADRDSTGYADAAGTARELVADADVPGTDVELGGAIVRLVLVPSTMELLGDLNWWLPKWLDRILPRMHVEASDDDVPAGRGAPQPVG